MTDWLLVLAGAAVGAPIRYLLGVEANHRLGSGFPWEPSPPTPPRP